MFLKRGSDPLKSALYNYVLAFHAALQLEFLATCVYLQLIGSIWLFTSGNADDIYEGQHSRDELIGQSSRLPTYDSFPIVEAPVCCPRCTPSQCTI
jgi:hypothetical protein